MREHLQVRRRNRRLPFLIAAAVAVVLAGGWYFLARPHVTQALAERRVKEIVDHFNASAEAQGGNVTLAYEAVSVTREKMRDVVVIKNPNVTLNQGAVQTVYGTPSLHLIPKNTDFGSLTVEARETLEAKMFDGTFTRVEHAEPLKVNLTVANAQSQPVITYDAVLPSTFDIKRYSSAPSPGTMVSHAAVTHDRPAVIKGKLDKAGNAQESEASLKNLRITDMVANKPILSAQAVEMHVRQTTAQKQVDSLYQFAVRGLELPGEMQDYGPFALALDLQVRGMMPDAAMPQPTPLGGMSMLLSKLEISGKNASLHGKGEMKTLAQDPLPVGSLVFDLQGLGYVIREMSSRGLLTDGQRALAEEIVRKSTGKTLEGNEVITLTVKRDPGGVLMVGQVSFDDLLALYVANAISNEGMPGVMQAPETQEHAPEATPIPEAPAETPQTE